MAKRVVTHYRAVEREPQSCPHHHRTVLAAMRCRWWRGKVLHANDILAFDGQSDTTGRPLTLAEVHDYYDDMEDIRRYHKSLERSGSASLRSTR